MPDQNAYQIAIRDLHATCLEFDHGVTLRGRLIFNVSLPEWFGAAAHPRSVRIVPISVDIAAQTALLPAMFYRAPAYRLIVASCRVLGLPLLTRDARILRSRLVTRWTGRP